MRITCPICGERDHREFTYKGAARAIRPPIGSTDMEAHKSYVYARANTPGDHDEIWLHTGGCRRHVRVRRNTTTHAVSASEPVGPWRDTLDALNTVDPVGGDKT